MAKPKPIVLRKECLSPDNLIPTYIVYDSGVEELIDARVEHPTHDLICREKDFDTEAQAISVAKEHLEACKSADVLGEDENFVIIFKAVKVVKADFNPVYTTLPIKAK